MMRKTSLYRQSRFLFTFFSIQFRGVL